MPKIEFPRMERFYADIQPIVRREEPSRASGIRGHFLGWNVGVSVEIFVDKEGKDSIRVFRTGGSNGQSGEELMTEFQECQD